LSNVLCVKSIRLKNGENIGNLSYGEGISNIIIKNCETCNIDKN